VSTGTKRPLREAEQIADRFRGLFSGCYRRWEVAGSVRRRRPTVGDIEHVVIGDAGSILDGGLIFPREGSLLLERRDDLLRRGLIAKAVYPDGSHRWGERYFGVMFEGHRNEVFVADAQNWGAILAIRTGPAELSLRLVTELKSRGRFRQDKGYVRYANGPSAGDVLAMPTEERFFEVCGIEFRPPWERDATPARAGEEMR
jgi:DNA polymerase/3'-5' exonuclease PolX